MPRRRAWPGHAAASAAASAWPRTVLVLAMHGCLGALQCGHALFSAGCCTWPRTVAEQVMLSESRGWRDVSRQRQAWTPDRFRKPYVPAAMANFSQLIQYQRSCYQADNRETSISNLLHEKIRHLRFFDGEEVALSGTISRVPLPSKLAEQVRKDTYKFRRDKQLVYAAFPFVGAHSELKQLGKHLCAPLVYFPSGISEASGNWFLVPDLEDLHFNFPVLTALGALCGVGDEEIVDFCTRLPAAPWRRDQVHSTAAGLADMLSQVDFTPLSSFPKLSPAQTVRALATDSKGSLQCIPASAMALIPNSPDTRGVLFELEMTARSKQLSRPLRALLGDTLQSGRSGGMKPRHLAPSQLSAAQNSILNVARTHSLSLVIGPPGTGKSHTIASLALDHVARNKTVLIASRMDQAVNVVAEKIEQLLGPSLAVVRAGRKQHLREMKSNLGNLLQGISPSDSSGRSAKQLLKDLKRLDRKIAQDELGMVRNHQREIAWGELNGPTNPSFWGRLAGSLLHKWHDWQLSDFDGWQQMLEYEGRLRQRTAASRAYIVRTLQERTARLVRKRRGNLTKFLQAIRARSAGKQQQLFDEINFSVLLHAFPIWLTKLADLSNVLPLKSELFDLAILDESTQCDIASCLPLLQRAKRAVIVGDPKQLRHVSFLAELRQQAIAEEQELNAEQQARYHYRNHSILDAASDVIQNQDQVLFLNEHFRSLPQIIEFSNAEFYSQSLAIMRQRPYAVRPTAVEIRPVAGTRTAAGRNNGEADAIVHDVLHLITDSASSFQTRPTIGILSPFREQVDHLSRCLDRSVHLEQMQQHDLLVGTAHTFQGEERDVMFLSLAADSHSHSATFRFLSNPNLLNVAITRARHRQLVYLSFMPEQLQPGSLLRKWLHTVQNPRLKPPGELKLLDSFRNEVVLALEALGFKLWKDTPVAGIEIDLIVESTGQVLGLDLIGYPGMLAEAYSLERYRMLARSGMTVLPISWRAWQAEQSKCIQRIVDVLECSVSAQPAAGRQSDSS